MQYSKCNAVTLSVKFISMLGNLVWPDNGQFSFWESGIAQWLKQYGLGGIDQCLDVTVWDRGIAQWLKHYGIVGLIKAWTTIWDSGIAQWIKHYGIVGLSNA